MIYANDNFFLAIGIPNEPPPRILIEPTYFPEIVRSSVGRGYNGVNVWLLFTFMWYRTCIWTTNLA